MFLVRPLPVFFVYPLEYLLPSFSDATLCECRLVGEGLAYPCGEPSKCGGSGADIFLLAMLPQLGHVSAFMKGSAAVKLRKNSEKLRLHTVQTYSYVGIVCPF